MDLDPIRLKVLKLLKNRKPPTDMKGASLAMGRNAAYLHQFVYRGSPKVLSEDDREALANHLGCEPDELKHKKTPPRKPRKKVALKEGRVEPSSATAAPEGYRAIPEIDVRASAGPGALNEGLEETKEMWFFPDPVIRHEFRARPADLRMITIDGDSMEPYPSRPASSSSGMAWAWSPSASSTSRTQSHPWSSSNQSTQNTRPMNAMLKRFISSGALSGHRGGYE
jgi:hypothetical protein